MSLQEEIRQAAYQGAKEAQNAVVFPDTQKVEVTNWPEEKDTEGIEKVEVTNLSEIKIPETPAPVVNVSTTEVVVEKADLTELAEMFSKHSALLQKIAEKESPSFDYKEFERIAQENKSVYKGGGVGPSKQYLMNKLGVAVNPSLSGEILSGNSSSAALTDGSSFTGEWADVSSHDSVVISIATDKGGVYSAQFSSDGTNIDSTLTRYHKAGKIHAPHRFTVTRKYFRLVFTNNSGEDQTYFRAQCLTGPKTPLNVPLDGVVSQDYDATIVRPTNYHDEIQLGLRQGLEGWNKFGYCPTLASGAEYTVWTAGSNIRLTPLTTASTFTITYTGGGGANDGAGATGARTLGFWYVDVNRMHQYAEHTLGSDGSDVTSFTGLGINRVKVVSAGTARANNAAITVTATTGGTVQAHVPVGDGITQQAFYFTSASHKGLAGWLHINIVKVDANNKPVVTVRGWVKDYVNNVDAEVFRETIDTAVQNNFQLNPQLSFPIPESSLLEFTAETDVNNTEIGIRFDVIHIEDVDA